MRTPASVLIALFVYSVVSGAGGMARAGVLYSDAVLASNPVGYWRLDETAGSAINLGSAGSSLDGVYNNFPTGVRGVAGLINDDPNTAADFNGLQGSGGSTISDSTGMNTAVGGVSNPFAGDWSIEAWFVRDSVNFYSGIFSNNFGVGGPAMTFISTTNKLGINGVGITGNNVSVDLGAGSLGQLVYAVVTKTGGNANGTANLTVYANVNDTWLPTATGTNSGWNLTPNDGYHIGRHWDSGSLHNHDGILDEVAIYDRALTLAELEQHYAVATALTAVAVPEPTSLTIWSLLGLCAASYNWRKRRRFLVAQERSITK